jgi:hypothetical protein
MVSELPEAGAILIQGMVSDTTQLVFAVRVRPWPPPAAAKESEAGDTVKDVDAAAWVTVTDCIGTSVPKTIIIPVRTALVVFGAQVTVITPLLEPAPVLREIQLRVSPSVQLVLEVIANVFVPPSAVKFRLVGLTPRLKGAPA